MEPSGCVPREMRLGAGTTYRSDMGLVFRSPKTQETCLMFALTDIDGTLNNEHVSESERIHTIAPACEAIDALQSYGVLVGICTARANGEAEMYARAVRARGFVISENGACTGHPGGTPVTIGDMREIRECVAAIETALGRSVVSTLDLTALESRWHDQVMARRERSGVDIPAQEDDLGHSTLEELRISAARVASAYLSGLAPAEREVASSIARAHGFRPFGDLLHLINRRADKGVALDALCERLLGEELLVSDASGARMNVLLDRVTPIVFGNGENDLPLFASAIERGGYGVLVADPVQAHGFHFDLRAQPPHPHTLITHGAPFGHGIKAAVPELVSRVRDRYGILLAAR